MFKLNQTATQVISNLILSNKIPSSGDFSITEDLLLEYRKEFLKFKPKNWVENKIADRKFAGLTLLSLKYSRGLTARETPEGFIYFIKNPAWPTKVKVGLTGNFIKRLASYQTYSPARDYVLEGWEFVVSKRDAEKLLLNKFKLDYDVGEWVTNEVYTDLVLYLRALINSPSIITEYDNGLKIGDKVNFDLPKEPRQVGTVVRLIKGDRLEVQRTKINGAKAKNIIHVSQLSNKGPRKRSLEALERASVQFYDKVSRGRGEAG